VVRRHTSSDVVTQALQIAGGIRDKLLGAVLNKTNTCQVQWFQRSSAMIDQSHVGTERGVATALLLAGETIPLKICFFTPPAGDCTHRITTVPDLPSNDQCMITLSNPRHRFVVMLCKFDLRSVR
jgi:hypothetical protein